MTADVIDMRREIADIAARREDCIRNHPATRSKERLQVERQQQLGSLIAALADGRLDLNDDQDLPLIVGTLLTCCPQVRRDPDVVAKSLQEAANGTPEDAAFIASQLAAGTAHTATYGYLLNNIRMLADWLAAAAR